MCPEVHFPLLNPLDFDDLESFTCHDHFAVDLGVDKVCAGASVTERI